MAGGDKCSRPIPLHPEMENQSTISITFRLTPRDLYKVYLRNLLRSWLLIPIILCMIGIVVLSALSDRSAQSGYLIPALQFVAFVGALAGLVFLLPYVLARNTFKSSPLFSQEMRYTFSESDVESSTAASQGRVAWQGFHRAVELKDFFVLYLSSRVFYIIPLRSFSGPEQVETFRALLSRNMAGRVKLRS